MSNTLFTCASNPLVEVQSEKGVQIYFNKLSTCTLNELYIELSNVRAAKYNIKFCATMGVNMVDETQLTITDLNDKVYLLFLIIFGQKTMFNYIKDKSNNSMREFNELIDILDEEVASYNLQSVEHGKKLIEFFKQRYL